MEEEKEMETPETETETGTETPEAEKPELSKTEQSALAQKEHFRNKAEKAEAALEEYKKNNPPKATEIEKVKTTTVSDDVLETVKLGKVLSKYNDEETDLILKIAPTKDLKGILEAEKNPYIQAAIQAMREKVETEQAVSEPSGAVSGGFKVKTAEELAKLKPEEMRAYAESFTKNKARSSGI